MWIMVLDPADEDELKDGTEHAPNRSMAWSWSGFLFESVIDPLLLQKKQNNGNKNSPNYVF